MTTPVHLIMFVEVPKELLAAVLQAIRDLDVDLAPDFHATVAITDGDISLEEGKAIFEAIEPPFPYVDTRHI